MTIPVLQFGEYIGHFEVEKIQEFKKMFRKQAHELLATLNKEYDAVYYCTQWYDKQTNEISSVWLNLIPTTHKSVNETLNESNAYYGVVYKK